MSKNLSSRTNIDYLIPKSEISKAVSLVFGTIVLFFLGQFVGVLLIVLILTLFTRNASEVQTLLTDNILVQFVSILAVELVTIFLIYYVLKIRKKPLWDSVGLGSRPELKHFGYAALTYVIYFMVFLLVASISSVLIPALDVDQPQQLGFESPVGIELALVYASLVILPSFTEEVLFRGFLFQRLGALIKTKPAAVITSLVFACAHLEFFSGAPLNWIAFIDTFIFSIFLIWLLVRTKSLWPSIFLHALKNSIAFMVLFVIQ